MTVADAPTQDQLRERTKAELYDQGYVVDAVWRVDMPSDSGEYHNGKPIWVAVFQSHGGLREAYREDGAVNWQTRAA